MDGLEKRIFNGCIRAQKTYSNMTGGWWLWHGPESFIQHEVARSIRRSHKGFEAYAETSPRKIMAEHDLPLRGRPLKEDRLRQRFDVVVWKKTKNELRAVIEIKRGGAIVGQVARDAGKIQKYLSLKNSRGTGICYFTRKRVGRIEKISWKNVLIRCVNK
jgi:hypothetical protein